MKKLMVAIAAAAISFAGFADDTNNWFTAGFGAEALSSGGAWSPAASSLTWGDENVLVLEDVGADAPVKFAAEEAKAGAATNADSTVVFDTTVTFQGFEDLPTIEDGAKAGVCALTDGNYYVVAYDDVGSTNKWVDTGFEAAFDVAVNVKVTVANGKAVYTFTDQFRTDGTDPLDLVDAEFQEVCYSGNGSVSALAADTILAGVAIVVPTIEGLKVTCDKVRAGIGDEVTLSFEKDTKFPSIPSAKYTVGADGTLALKTGEPQVEALDPGAQIGTVFYLTFNEAYEAATEDDEDPITLCTDQYLESDIDKSIKIDLAGNDLTVTNAVAINGVEVVFDDSAEEVKGKLVLEAVLSVADGSASLVVSAIAFECDGGYLTGVDGMISVSEDMVSANKMLFEGYFGEAPEELSVIVQVGEELVYNGAGDRFAIEGEVAYATVGEEGAQYIESFASVQAAIEAANEVYLCFGISGVEYPEEDITFADGKIVYAEATYGEEALANCTLFPEGEVEFDGSCGDYGAWVYSGEPPTPTYYTLTFPLRNEGVHALVTNLTTGAFWNFDGPSTNSVVVEEGSFVTEILSSTKPGYEASGTTISWTDIKKDIEFPEFEARPIKYTITYHDATVTNGVFEYTIETETFALPTSENGVEVMPGGNFLGWTNSVGVAVTEVEKGKTGNLDFYANWEAAGIFYPTYIPDDDGIKEKFNDWATNKNGGDRDGASANIDAFLLNCEPTPGAVAAAKAVFKIISITKTEDGWVCKVAGEKGEGAEYGNGYVHFVSVKEKFGSDGTSSDFFQATLTLENPATE